MDADAIEKENFLIPRFGALCFFLATVEYIIPKPLPFMRLGIANLPLVLAAGFFPLRVYILLALVKIIAQGIVGGTFFSWLFVFSAAGTFSSAATMFLLKRIAGNKISAVGLSTAGAVVSNGMQLVIAVLWIFGGSALTAAPVLLAAGTISGFAIGIFAEICNRKSKWLAEIRNKNSFGSGGENPNFRDKPENRISKRGVLRLLFGFSVTICAALVSSLFIRFVLFFTFFTALCVTKKQPAILPVLVTLVSVTVFNLYPPCGQILFQAGPIKITSFALSTGLSRALLFETLIFISRWTFQSGSFGLPLKGTRWRLLFLVEKTFEFFTKLNSALSTFPKEKRKIKLKEFPGYMDKLLNALDT